MCIASGREIGGIEEVVDEEAEEARAFRRETIVWARVVLPEPGTPETEIR